jgi:acylphosphatase
MDRIAVHLIIRGRVQGVGYRWWALDEARRRDLDGWVRNRLNGTVELLAAGPEALVEQMVQACWEGPPAAAVQAIERSAAEDDGLGRFEERPTA